MPSQTPVVRTYAQEHRANSMEAKWRLRSRRGFTDNKYVVDEKTFSAFECITIDVFRTVTGKALGTEIRREPQKA